VAVHLTTHLALEVTDICHLQLHVVRWFVIGAVLGGVRYQLIHSCRVPETVDARLVLLVAFLTISHFDSVHHVPTYLFHPIAIPVIFYGMFSGME